MKKVYIVTGGEYSDYSIYAVFSSKEKAKEYIENRLKVENAYGCSFCKDYFRIEKYDIDEDVELAEEIELKMEFIDDNGIIRNIETETDISLEFKAEIKEKIEYFEQKYETNFYLKEYKKGYMKIVRIKNNNKDNESEIERVKKIGYDTIKRINYIKKVLGIEDIEEINKMINTR